MPKKLYSMKDLLLHWFVPTFPVSLILGLIWPSASWLIPVVIVLNALGMAGFVTEFIHRLVNKQWRYIGEPRNDN